MPALPGRIGWIFRPDVLGLGFGSFEASQPRSLITAALARLRRSNPDV